MSLSIGRNFQVVGYRGDNERGPENTKAAVREAFFQGADRVVVDVRQTADGQVVLMNDATVDRTTGGSGRVDQMTLADVRKLDAGFWLRPPFMGERVPTLEETLDWTQGKIAVDVHLPPKPSDDLLNNVVGLLAKHPAPSVVASAELSVIEKLSRANPQQRTALIYTHRHDGMTACALLGGAVTLAAAAAASLPHWASALLTIGGGAAGAALRRFTNIRRDTRAALESPARTLIPTRANISEKFIEQAHANGKLVMPYVGNLDRTTPLPQGVDGVVANRPGTWTTQKNAAAEMRMRAADTLPRLPGVASVSEGKDGFQVAAASAQAAADLSRLLADKVADFTIGVVAPPADTRPVSAPIGQNGGRAFTDRYHDYLTALPGVYGIQPHHTDPTKYRMMAYSNEDVAFLKAFLKPKVDSLTMSIIKVRITPGKKAKGN